MELELESITKFYGKYPALQNVSATLTEGVYGLLGPNGAGKTTLINILIGILPASGGVIHLDGENTVQMGGRYFDQIGYMPQYPQFYANFTVQEFLDYMCQVKGVANAKESIDAALVFVNLEENRSKRIGALSGGMRQRLGIADVLMKDPKVVIMDEPTLGIDPEGMRELMTLIRGLAEDDKRTILISSHQLYQIQQICDRVGLFVEGRLIACGRIDELAGQMRREGHYALEAAAFPDDSGFEELLRSLGNVEQVERSGDFYVVHSRADLCRELNRRALEKGYTLRHLRQRGNDLDEIYRRYFEKGEQKNGGLNQKKNKGFLSFGREQR